MGRNAEHLGVVLLLLAAQPAQVKDEDGDQHDRIDQVQLVDPEEVTQRDRHRVEGGGPEEDELDGPVLVEHEDRRGIGPVAPLPADGEEGHGRPSDTDEESVGAGHVGQGPVGLGVSARLDGEHQVDGVLGQHRDEGQDGDGDTLTQVDLGRFPGPRQQQRGADHSDAEDGGVGDGVGVVAGGAQHDGRDAEAGDEQETAARARG